MKSIENRLSTVSEIMQDNYKIQTENFIKLTTQINSVGLTKFVPIFNKKNNNIVKKYIWIFFCMDNRFNIIY